VRYYFFIGAAVLIAAFALGVGPARSQGMSEREINEVICGALSDWLRKKERSREIKAVLRKPRNKRTRKEQRSVAMVEIVRDQYKREKCG